MALNMQLTSLIIATIIAPSAGRIAHPTPHYERCRNIVQYNNTDICTRYQTQHCTATKTNLTDHKPHDTCVYGKDCPPPISDLHVSLYKENVSADRRSEHYGANVSWCVRRTGSDKDVAPMKFFMIVSAGYRSRRVEIDVNLTMEDYVNDKAWINFDCNYPMMDNKDCSLTVGTIPSSGANLTHTFATVPSALATTGRPDPPTSTKWTTIGPSSGSTATPAILPANDQSKSGDLSGTSDLKQALVYGLVAGTCAIAALVVCVMLVKCRHTIKNRLGSWCTSEKQSASKPYYDSSDERVAVKSIALVYANNDVEHSAKCAQLAKSLDRISQVTDIWTCPTESRHHHLLSASSIIIVISESLLSLWNDESKNSYPESVTSTICFLKQNKQSQEKIKLVAYGDVNSDQYIFGNTIEPLILPGQLPYLLSLLDKDDSKAQREAKKDLVVQQTSYSDQCTSDESGYVHSPATLSENPDNHFIVPAARVQTLPPHPTSCPHVQYLPQQALSPCCNGYHNPAYYHEHCTANFLPCSQMHSHPPCLICHESQAQPDIRADVPQMPDDDILSGKPLVPDISAVPRDNSFGCKPLVYPRMYGSFSDMDSVFSSEVYNINKTSDDMDFSSVGLNPAKSHDRFSPILPSSDSGSDISLTTTL